MIISAARSIIERAILGRTASAGAQAAAVDLYESGLLSPNLAPGEWDTIAGICHDTAHGAIPAGLRGISADRWHAIADALIVHAESIRQHGGGSA